MIEENPSNSMSPGLEAGNEELIFTAILLHHILNDGVDAFHVEVKLAGALNSIPDLVRVLITGNTSVTGPAICNHQGCDENKWKVFARACKIGCRHQEISIGAVNHYDDGIFLATGPRIRQRQVILNWMGRCRL